MSFFTLFRCVMGGDCAENAGRPIFLEVTTIYGWWYGLIYCALVFFMTMGLFNVIGAIFVENVVTGAKTSNQLVKRQRLRDKVFFADKIHELLWLIIEIDQSRCSVRRRNSFAVLLD